MFLHCVLPCFYFLYNYFLSHTYKIIHFREIIRADYLSFRRFVSKNKIITYNDGTGEDGVWRYSRCLE